MEKGLCCIVGAGVFYDHTDFLRQGEYKIAADGGYDTFVRCGMTPDLVIGDLDSVKESIGDGIDTIPLLPIKDDTDMLAALKIGMEKGYQKFYLLGGTGGRRISHTFANIQLLQYNPSVQCFLFDEEEVLFCISNGKVVFGKECQGYLSVFSFSSNCYGVTEQNLAYELEDQELSNQFPLGVSNAFIGKESLISVKQGVLLIVVNKECLPYIICENGCY